MDSITFSYIIDPRQASFPFWLLHFKCIDVFSRKILLSSYVATGEFDGVTISLPDQITVYFLRTSCPVKPFNHQAILEITRGPLDEANTGVSTRATRAASSFRKTLATNTAELYTFGVTKELYAEMLKGVSDYIRNNPRQSGGHMTVSVKRIRTYMVRRYDDPEVDLYVESNLWGPDPVPADSSAIDALEAIRFSRQCSICLEDFDDGSMITRLPCDHLFHGECIKPWLQINRCCPLCRKPIS